MGQVSDGDGMRNVCSFGLRLMEDGRLSKPQTITNHSKSSQYYHCPNLVHPVHLLATEGNESDGNCEADGDDDGDSHHLQQ